MMSGINKIILEGLAGKDATEVFGAINAADQVIVKGSDDVKDGDPIN